MDKSLIRKQIRAKLVSMNRSTLQRRDDLITSQLHQLIAERKPQRVCCYQSRASLYEVATKPVITTLSQSDSVSLTLIESHSNAKVPTGQFDLIIVPVLAFDNQFNRIGRGGGWYDKFLATQPAAHKVGLAYSEQLVDAIDVERHDIRLDTVLYA